MMDEIERLAKELYTNFYKREPSWQGINLEGKTFFYEEWTDLARHVQRLILEARIETLEKFNGINLISVQDVKDTLYKEYKSKLKKLEGEK